MSETQHRRQLQIAAQALREGYLEPPDENRDQGIQDKLLDLFRYLQGCDLERMDQAPAAEKILMETALQMVLQLLESTPSQNRYNLLSTILCIAMESLAPLAYTREGNARFLLDLLDVIPRLPLLKCHARIEGHSASANGIRLNMIGFVKPCFKSDRAVKIFSDGLDALASSKGPLTLDVIIRNCTNLLCTRLKK